MWAAAGWSLASTDPATDHNSNSQYPSHSKQYDPDHESARRRNDGKDQYGQLQHQSNMETLTRREVCSACMRLLKSEREGR